MPILKYYQKKTTTTKNGDKKYHIHIPVPDLRLRGALWWKHIWKSRMIQNWWTKKRSSTRIFGIRENSQSPEADWLLHILYDNPALTHTHTHKCSRLLVYRNQMKSHEIFVANRARNESKNKLESKRERLMVLDFGLWLSSSI